LEINHRKPEMKIKLNLTECETETLVQMSINHPWRDARTRAAGMVMLNAKEHPTAIARKLGVSHQSLYNWRHGWEAKGLVGLMGGHAGGRPRLLPEAMLETAMTVARSEALTLKGIAERIEALHQCPLPCSLDVLSVRLRANGFSFKRTRLSLKKTAMPKNLPPAR
jgi:transposase